MKALLEIESAIRPLWYLVGLGRRGARQSPPGKSRPRLR